MMDSAPHDPKEVIAIVDENDRVIGRHERKNHAGGKLHREVAVLLVNKKGEVLVQIRDDKSMGIPRFLDYSAGGHLPFNESYLDGAVRETKEELGLKIARSRFKRITKKHLVTEYKGHRNDRFSTLYEVKGDYQISDLRIDKREMISVKFYALGELKKALKKEGNGGFKAMMRAYFSKRA